MRVCDAIYLRLSVLDVAGLKAAGMRGRAMRLHQL